MAFVDCGLSRMFLKMAKDRFFFGWVLPDFTLHYVVIVKENSVSYVHFSTYWVNRIKSNNALSRFGPLFVKSVD